MATKAKKASTQTTARATIAQPAHDDLPLPAKRATKPVNLQVRVSEHLLKRIQRLANEKGLPASAMARVLMMERLNELEGA